MIQPTHVYDRAHKSASEGKLMGRRRDYDEGYEDARREMTER
jgi:hypothetical protein